MKNAITNRLIKIWSGFALYIGSAVVLAQTVVPAGTPEKVVENPYGIAALWAGGDFVSRGVLIILLIMSAATWYVGFTKYSAQRKLLAQGQSLFGDGQISKKMSEVAKNGPYADISASAAEAALQVSSRRSLDADSWIANAVGEAIDRVNAHLQGGMSVLATVGSVSPFVGLFGTVWGIYHALTAIGIAGQASIDKVAGPVGEALIMTAIGLAVAVPAVLGYNWLLRRNKQIVEQARYHSGRLHAELVLDHHKV